MGIKFHERGRGKRSAAEFESFPRRVFLSYVANAILAMSMNPNESQLQHDFDVSYFQER